MMRACSSLILLALVGLQLALAHEEHMELANKQVTASDICKNRQVPIISVQEALRLINEVIANPELCPENYKQSFTELLPILELGKTERICSEKKFEQIKEYHFRYINPLVEDYTFGDDLNSLGSKIVNRPLTEAKVDYTVQLDDYKQEIKIPISLQQFFKAWAIQVSGICKKTLVDNLSKATEDLTDADINMIQILDKAEAKAEVFALTKGPSKKEQLSFYSLVYLPRLEGELEKGDAGLRDSLTVLDLRSKPQANRFMHACKRRFKPIYDKLVMPIVRLSKLGYEYVGPKIDNINNDLQGPEVRRWMELTMLCEAPGNFNLIEDPQNKIDMEVLNYEPMYNYRVDGDLWIKGAEALSYELNRLNGYKSTGFKKFLFDTGVMGRKVVASLDPHRFAWYRRNQNTLSSVLNILSITSNTIGLGVTLG